MKAQLWRVKASRKFTLHNFDHSQTFFSYTNDSLAILGHWMTVTPQDTSGHEISRVQESELCTTDWFCWEETFSVYNHKIPFLCCKLGGHIYTCNIIRSWVQQLYKLQSTQYTFKLIWALGLDRVVRQWSGSSGRTDGWVLTLHVGLDLVAAGFPAAAPDLDEPTQRVLPVFPLPLLRKGSSDTALTLSPLPQCRKGLEPYHVTGTILVFVSVPCSVLSLLKTANVKVLSNMFTFSSLFSLLFIPHVQHCKVILKFWSQLI